METKKHQLILSEIERLKAKIKFHQSKKHQLQCDLESEDNHIEDYTDRLLDAEKELNNVWRID